MYTGVAYICLGNFERAILESILFFKMPFVTDADYRQPDALIRSILQQDKSMPIAIVGMSCRFPGDATNPDKLWKLVAEKQAAWSEIPKDRMNVDAFYHPDAERAGNVCSQSFRYLPVKNCPN